MADSYRDVALLAAQIARDNETMSMRVTRVRVEPGQVFITYDCNPMRKVEP